jgi:hypothetical protein
MDFLRNAANKLLQITHGRTTAFFLAFFVTGHVVTFLHLLTPTYIGFMGTLGGLVLGHSIKEDYAEAHGAPQRTGGIDADAKS